MECILCHNRNIGTVGKNRYFCSDCWIEFKICAGKSLIYNINLEGQLLQYCVNNEKGDVVHAGDH